MDWSVDMTLDLDPGSQDELGGERVGIAGIVSRGPERRIVVWDEARRVWLWNAALTACEPISFSRMHRVGCAALADDGRTLVTGGAYEPTVQLCELEAQQPLRAEFRDHDAQGHITAVDVSPDGRFVAGCSLGGSWRVWDASSKTDVAGGRQRNSILSVAFSHDESRVILVNKSGSVQVWDVGQQREVVIHQPAAVYVKCAAVSPCRPYVIVGGGRKGSGYLKQYHIATGELAPVCQTAYGEYPHCVSQVQRWPMGLLFWVAGNRRGGRVGGNRQPGHG